MNVAINVNSNVARICLMHSIGTSLTMWVFTIIRETADAIAQTDAENYGKKISNQKILLDFSLNKKSIFFLPLHFNRQISNCPIK